MEVREAIWVVALSVAEGELNLMEAVQGVRMVHSKLVSLGLVPPNKP